VKTVTESVLLDTGPLVALLRESDGHHELCREQAGRISGQVMTSWAVVTEAAWLLRHEPTGLPRLLRALDDKDIQCLHLETSAVTWLAERAIRYQDMRPQLADLSLLYLADQIGIDHIFTLDRRDFLVYRQITGAPFILLPEAVPT
jgi:uncharacterized protein